MVLSISYHYENQTDDRLTAFFSKLIEVNRYGDFEIQLRNFHWSGLPSLTRYDLPCLQERNVFDFLNLGIISENAKLKSLEQKLHYMCKNMDFCQQIPLNDQNRHDGDDLADEDFPVCAHLEIEKISNGLKQMTVKGLELKLAGTFGNLKSLQSLCLKYCTINPVCLEPLPDSVTWLSLVDIKIVNSLPYIIRLPIQLKSLEIQGSSVPEVSNYDELKDFSDLEVEIYHVTNNHEEVPIILKQVQSLVSLLSPKTADIIFPVDSSFSDPVEFPKRWFSLEYLESSGSLESLSFSCFDNDLYASLAADLMFYPGKNIKSQLPLTLRSLDVDLWKSST
ncbi:unnamed protein product [Ambrosiozyma monospora]|uniref:Unnamed protein product n=1 Tax=Ambrosiozyma monospora TaxID=43982 RepID=A0ACB5U880_AMBMO|nr:unnamed protein product [Ambrosiozyma monospora]